MRATLVWGMGISLAAGCGATCDADALRAALESAAPGATVQAEACVYEGSFHVPAGVTLRGRGEEATTIAAREGEVGVELAGTLEALAIESHGVAAVAVRAGAEASIADVAVRADRGIAIGVEDATATLERIRLEGPVTVENANDPAWIRVLSAPPASGVCPAGEICDCTPGARDGERACDASGQWAELAATYGLYAQRAALTIAGLDVRGFARFGVVLDGSTTGWTDGGVHQSLGVGVEVLGGSAMLERVTIDEVLSGLLGAPSYALIAARGAALTSRALVLRDNDRYGLVQLGSTGMHEALVAERQGDASIWVQDSTQFTLTGEGTRIAAGSFAGVVVVGSSHTHLSDASIEGVSASRRPVGIIGAIEVGDGVHVTGSHDDVRLERLTISGQARAGILVDLDGTAPLFDAVRVDAAGSALGAIAGTPVGGTDEIEVSAPAGWDLGIARTGAASANDLAFTGRLGAVFGTPPSSGEVLGVVAPMF